MSIASLSIRTSPTVLNYHSQPAKIHIENPKGSQLDIKIEQPQLEMQSTQPKVLIDQSQCFAESGLKSIGALISDTASFAYSKGLEAIGKIVDQGNQMADVHKGDPIPDQAAYNAYDQFVREWNIVTMPRSRPDITVIEGKVNITVKRGQVQNNTRLQLPKITYNPGKLDIYVKQHYSIKINVVNDYV